MALPCSQFKSATFVRVGERGYELHARPRVECSFPEKTLQNMDLIAPVLCEGFRRIPLLGSKLGVQNRGGGGNFEPCLD